MEEYLEVRPGIHLNRFDDKRTFTDIEFDIKDEENQDVIDTLELFFDGTIVGVKLEVIKSYLDIPEIKECRLKLRTLPKKFELKTVDDFYKYIALHIPLDQYA